MTELVKEISDTQAILEMAPNILEVLDDGIVIVGPDRNICYMNSSAENLFDYSRVEVVGKPIETLLPEESRTAHQQHTAKYLTAPRPRRMGLGLKLEGRRKNGTTFPCEISLTPFRVPYRGTFTIAAVRVQQHE